MVGRGTLASVADAAAFCLSQPHCTSFTLALRSRFATFCQVCVWVYTASPPAIGSHDGYVPPALLLFYNV
eukprot:4700290-Pyramimonas_sp.AAC.1